MSEKKIAVGLGALSILLVITLAGLVTYFSLSSNSMINNKESEINVLRITNGNLNSQTLDLQVANGNLKQQISNLETTNAQLDKAVNDLKTQMDNLRTPYLANVGLGAFDEGTRTPFSPSLRISGYVCNVGIDAAYNAKLHVVAYFVSGATAIDTEIPIWNGIISGGASAQINLNITYSKVNATLASWKMTPQWTSTP